MTDKNGKPLKVGDKVTYDRAPGYGVGQVLSLFEFARVQFIGYEDEYCDPKDLTLVEPKPEPVGYKADGTPIDLGGDDSIKAMRAAFATLKKPNPFSVGLFGHIPLATYEPKPIPEPDYKGMLDEANENLRRLTRAATQYLTCERGSLEQASAYARLRDAVKEAL